MSDISAAHGGASANGSPAAEPARYLTFTLNGDAYALDIFHVIEILEHRRLTVVPTMPEFVRGVINLRGRAVPVIDLAVRLSRGSTEIKKRTSVIIVHINDASGDVAGASARGKRTGQDIGILVDTVNKVVAFEDDDIEPAPAFGAGIRADYISGMARREGDFVIVLDVDNVLSIADMAGLAGPAAGAPAGHGGTASEVPSA
ncbi:chemotaxis protein CheW [Planomonospora alba]|uniref:Chemotaxis protein CheW n=1 Tax=Planomonospora alba TaxID=161354 RepID=A0ABP6NKC8_9ACTN